MTEVWRDFKYLKCCLSWRWWSRCCIDIDGTAYGQVVSNCALIFFIVFYSLHNLSKYAICKVSANSTCGMCSRHLTGLLWFWISLIDSNLIISLGFIHIERKANNPLFKCILWEPFHIGDICQLVRNILSTENEKIKIRLGK